VKYIQIGNKKVGEGQPTFIIAEAGINHQGDIEIAIKLIDLAKEAGADLVKFQKRSIERILTKEGLEKPYDNPNSFGKTYGEHKRALELSNADYRILKKHADTKGILFSASPWDEESADFLESLGIPVYKIASPDLTNLPLLEHVAKKGKPVIVSTGMADLKEVEDAFNTITKYTSQLILMHCVSTYPANFEHLNLRVINMLKGKFGVPVGYSGHEPGIAVGAAAVAVGAVVIEKHFTLDRTMKGSDHAASLEISGIKKIIRDIRAVEKALGSTEKKLIPEEIPIRQKLAKSIVSKVKIPRDAKITRDMLTTKGPGTGISPGRIKEVIGKKTK